MDSRRPGRACAPLPGLFNVPDRCGVAYRAGVPAGPGGAWRATPVADARPAGRRALRPAERLRLAHLPRDFPPWQTTLRWFLRLARSGAFERMAHALTIADRERAGRGASPTAAVVDAQSARSGGVGVAGRRGYNAAKRVVRRKRHVLVDTNGRLLLAAVSPAHLHDSHGGIALLRTSRRSWPFIALCYADRAYAGQRVASATPVRVKLVGPKPGQHGFAVQPRRWVIERTFAWTGRCRRLARDHEATPSSAVAFFVLAAATVLLRRLAKAS